MNIVSRFLKLPETGMPTIRLSLDGRQITAQASDSLAAAILAHSGEALRHTPLNDAPRTAFCMMGVCFDCLVTVDGQANVQACMTQVREGMDVRRQSGLPAVGGGDV